MSGRITIDSTVLEAATALAEGNPGAASVIGKVLENSEFGLIDLAHLDDDDIYGADIWIGYKDVCKQDLGNFLEMARNHTLKNAIEEAKP